MEAYTKDTKTSDHKDIGKYFDVSNSLNSKENNPDKTYVDGKYCDVSNSLNSKENNPDVTYDSEVVIEVDDSRSLIRDGGWGWVIVLVCVLLRFILGGIGRSESLFFVKFLERFNGTAAQTAWVTSLGGTTRLLVGPIVSVLCSRYSCRKLIFIGAILYVTAINVSGHATSLTYLYMSYGILGGLGRAFLLTPCVLLLSQYFSKKASLAFGLASTGFGLGGFILTPIIEVLFQSYGFNGTFLVLSGVACNLFICATLIKAPNARAQPEEKSSKDSSNTIDIEDGLNKDDDLTDGPDILISTMASTGSVHLVNSRIEEAEMEPLTTEINEFPRERRQPLNIMMTKLKQIVKPTRPGDMEKKKWISVSILKDVRFLTLCFATFLFAVPGSGMFLAALARERGLTDLESAYIVSITAGCDTFIRVISGFIMDLNRVRPYRALIYNVTSFLQGLLFFLIPQAQTFWQFACICALRGMLMGLKAAQRSVVLLDILGVQNLPSSFAYLLTVQGVGTLVGPPVSGFLKDHYGKYDYAYYFGGAAIVLGSFVLAYGNIRNWRQTRRKTKSNEHESNGKVTSGNKGDDTTPLK